MRVRVGSLLFVAFQAHFLRNADPLIAPMLARDFELDAAGITALAGWTSLGALGSFALARLADVRGRRGVLLACQLGLAPLCIAAALAPGVVGYALARASIGLVVGTLLATATVALAEEAPPERRASAQAYNGITSRIAAGAVLLLVAFLPGVTGTWRWIFALAALPVVCVPLVRRALPETALFRRAEAAGHTRESRMRDLLRGERRRQTLGLLLSGLLLDVAAIATASWSYYFAVESLGLSAGVAAAIIFAGGVLGLLGNPVGIRLCDRWGRRPTFAGFSTLTLLAGVSFYHVPAGLGTHALVIALTAVTALASAASAIFHIARRCISTELFPTELRATYAGWSSFAIGLALVGSPFAVSACIRWLGDLDSAISLLVVAALVPALATFLASVPETRGRDLGAL